jgi:hypothetical protein
VTVNHQQVIDINSGKTIVASDKKVLHGTENKDADQLKPADNKTPAKPCVK